MYGMFTISNTNTGCLAWKGKWAMNAEDMNGNDSSKKSAFEYVGIPTMPQATSLSSISSSNIATSLTDISHNCNWKGFIKLSSSTQGWTNYKVEETIQSVCFTQRGEGSSTFNVTINGDNIYGKFVIEGTLTIDTSTLKGQMNMVKVYETWWSKQNIRPRPKRVASLGSLSNDGGDNASLQEAEVVSS